MWKGFYVVSCTDSSLGPLYFTYGIVFACGCSFAYQPSLIILGHYFKKRLGLVNGIVTAGSSVFTITLPLILTRLLERVGLQNTMRVLCIVMFVLMLAGFTYKPLLPVKPSNTHTGSRCPPMSQIFNFNIWRSLGYRIWAFGIPAALYGYFVPYVHLVSLHPLPSNMSQMYCMTYLCCLGLLWHSARYRSVRWWIVAQKCQKRNSTVRSHKYPRYVHVFSGGTRAKDQQGSFSNRGVETDSVTTQIVFWFKLTRSKLQTPAWVFHPILKMDLDHKTQY